MGASDVFHVCNQMVPLPWVSDSHFSSRKKWGKEATDDHPDTNPCSKFIGTIRAFYLSNCHSRKRLISTGTPWAVDGEMSEVNPGLLPANKTNNGNNSITFLILQVVLYLLTQLNWQRSSLWGHIGGQVQSDGLHWKSPCSPWKDFVALDQSHGRLKKNVCFPSSIILLLMLEPPTISVSPN